MPTPQLPRDDLAKWMREIESRVAQVEKRDAFMNTAFSVPSPGVTKVEGTLIVDGTIESSNYDASTQGWAMDNRSMTSFTAIQGFVGGQSIGATAQNFNLSTTKKTLATATASTPTGFTRCNAFAFGQIYMSNPNTTGGSNGTGGDAIYSQVFMGTTYGASLPTGISGGNGFATSTAGWVFSQTGLTSGQTVSFTVQGYTAYATIAASAGNTAVLAVALQWLP